ncbi:putative transcription factor interactor and regulator CCHC(Zn) family [Helianthus anomalus]
MDPNSHVYSAANQNDSQQTGIRATVERDDDVSNSSSSMMPCKHYSDKKKERRKMNSLHRRCYYCNEPDHQLVSCKTKENVEATQLIRHAINTGIQQHDADEDQRDWIILEQKEGCGPKSGMIFPTFSVRVINKRNDIFGLTKEDEIGMKERQSIINRGLDHHEYKTDYLNNYLENLNLSSNEPAWNIMILQAMQFNHFQDCKALLEMLDDVDYV